MTDGGTLFTMTYYGSEKVVENYNIMGVAKAALESAVRYLAAELGAQGHPRPRDLARPARHPGRLGHPRVRRAAREGQGQVARPGARRHRRRRHRLRLPRPRRCAPYDRPGPLHRRRIQHRRLSDPAIGPSEGRATPGLLSLMPPATKTFRACSCAREPSLLHRMASEIGRLERHQWSACAAQTGRRLAQLCCGGGHARPHPVEGHERR